jgi:hypothetical protein
MHETTPRVMTHPRRLPLTLFALTLAACGGGGGGGESSGTGNPPPPMLAPSVTLTATPEKLSADSTTTVAWSTSDATACMASGNWEGTRATSGNEMTPALFAGGIYTLTCTGAGGSTAKSVSVEVTPLVLYEVLESVKKLDASAAVMLVETTADHLTFNGPLTVNVGEVLMVNDLAYKVTSVDMVDGQTVVGIAEPALEEVFENLRLAGSASDLAGLQISSGKPGFGGPARKVETPINFQLGPVTLSANGVVDAKDPIYDIDYNILYGLRKARFELTVGVGVDGGAWRFDRFSGELKSPEFPIGPVFLGIPGLSADIFLRGKASVDAGFSAQGGTSFFVAVRPKVSYVEGDGFNGSIDVLDGRATMDITTYEGTNLGMGGATASITLLAQVLPSISFAHVSLAKIEIGAGPRVSASLSGPLDNLCLQFKSSAVLAGKAYITKLGDKFNVTSEKEFWSVPGTSLGDCRAPVALAANIIPETVVIGELVQIDLTVDNKGLLTGGTPTGTMTVDLDGEQCTANVFSTAQCSVKTTVGGKDRKVSIKYSGNTAYAMAQTQEVVTVRSPAITPKESTAVGGGQPVTLSLVDEEGMEMPLPAGSTWKTIDSVGVLNPLDDVSSARTIRWQAPDTAVGKDVEVFLDNSELTLVASATVHVQPKSTGRMITALSFLSEAGTYFTPTAVDVTGRVGGSIHSSDGPLGASERAVLYFNNTFTNVSSLVNGQALTLHEVLSISDSGYILARERTSTGGQNDYLLTPGTPSQSGTPTYTATLLTLSPGGNTFFTPTAVDDAGRVGGWTCTPIIVGGGERCDFRAVLFVNNAFTSVASLLSAQSVTLDEVVAMSDAGHIVARSYLDNGGVRYYLLMPIPDSAPPGGLPRYSAELFSDPAGSFFTPSSVNELGVVGGFLCFDDETVCAGGRAALYHNGIVTNFAEPGYVFSEVLSISDSGFVLVRDGETFLPGQRDYLVSPP